MTDLDTLARAATQELLERTTPDVRSRYAQLRRMRTRRATAKLAAVGAAVALAVGGWQLAGPHEQAVQPAPQPGGTHRNGVLLALPTSEVGYGARWATLSGTTPAHLPDDAALFAQYQFSSDGTEIVYADRMARISAIDLTTGRTRALVDCPDDTCAAAVSPDLGTVASSDGDGVWLQDVGSGEKHGLARSDVGATGAPAWSPDGSSLAFRGLEGIYVAELASGRIELVREIESMYAGALAWSPDGRQLAYFDARSVPGDDEVSLIAAVLDLATGKTTHLLNAGSCGCDDGAAPTLAWSPDGRDVVVATTLGGDVAQGVFLAPPDGARPVQLAAGSYAALAWQPLRG